MLRRGLNRGDHLWVCPAAADMPIHSRDDFRLAGMRVLAQEAHRAEYHAGSTPTALHRVGVNKRLLHGMQFARGRKTFNSDDPLRRDRPDLGHTRADGLTIDEHGAGGALAFTAAVLSSG